VPLDFNELRELLAAIAHTDIAEITLKSNDFELTVRKGIAAMPNVDPSLGNISPVMAAGMSPAPTPISAVPAPPIPIPQTPVKETVTASPAASPPKVDDKWLEIKSPMVGTFYRAPAPDEPPYVDIGDRIRNGQIVCIIEAMKLMNEIEAEVSGQVMEVLVNNGEPVEYNQVLMRINPG
jgi:acetyl-CoA carboxylase biotin carboxyl carrier protein